MSKLAQLIQDEIPENHVDLSLDARRVRRDLDKLIPRASENIPIYFLLPVSQMNLMRYMTEEQTRRVNRISQLGYDYLENMLKLMYKNPLLFIHDTSEKDEKNFPIQIGEKRYAYYLPPNDS